MQPSTTQSTPRPAHRPNSRHHRILARLPITTRPITGETLDSYIARLAACNGLPTNAWPLNQPKNPDLTATLEQLTGRPRRHLVCALPELRTPATLDEFPHLRGRSYQRAPTRPACTCCAAAIAGRAHRAIVFATHEQLVCHRHQRWLGSGELTCTAAEQFSLHTCTAIVRANARHHRLIRRWGRHAVHWRFEDAMNAFHSWGRWPIVDNDPSITPRRQELGVDRSWPLMSPRNIASWYPNAVELTALLLQQTADINRVGRVTAAIVEHGTDHIARHVVHNHRPEGAYDPYLRALQDRPFGTPDFNRPTTTANPNLRQLS